MKILLAIVVIIILIANFVSAEKSRAYCMKKVLRPKDLYVNGVKTKKYDTKIIRVCCDGYTKLRKRCVPICEDFCINSFCVAPNTCSCKKGYSKLNDHRCAPVCDNCKYGYCVAPGDCNCYKGYVQDNVTGTCSPVCSQPCINGYCSDPDFCTCNKGYKISRDNLYKCEWDNTLTTTTEETTFEISTPAIEDTSIKNELNSFHSTLPEELQAETTQTTISNEISLLNDKFPISASSISIHTSTVTPSEPAASSTKVLRIPKRMSKALYQMMLFADPPTTRESVEPETQKSENKTSTFIESSDTPSITPTLVHNMYKLSSEIQIFEKSTSEEPGTVAEILLTTIPSISNGTKLIDSSTIRQLSVETTEALPKKLLTTLFGGPNEGLSSTAVTLESVDYAESNDIIPPHQNITLIKEVRSSKFTLKDVLIVIYCLLAMLVPIGIYIVFWFICDCRRFHEKEYHIGRLEKKKGVVKYSVDQNDVITAW